MPNWTLPGRELRGDHTQSSRNAQWLRSSLMASGLHAAVSAAKLDTLRGPASRRSYDADLFLPQALQLNRKAHKARRGNTSIARGSRIWQQESFG